MPRSISLITRANLEQPTTGEALIWFATITHKHLSEAIRLVNDGADYIRDGETWHRSGFEITYITDNDSPPKAEFAFPNVDREAVFRFRRVSGPALITLEEISSSYFNLEEKPRTVKPGETVQTARTIPEVYLRGVRIDEEICSGTLGRLDPSTEQYPNKLATEALLPGLYAR